jgi:uncharacterized protein with LGFP repeats
LLVVPGGTAQAFSGGSVYSSAATGAHALPAAFLSPWWGTGGATGPYGFPVSDVLAVPGGTAVAFQGGSVYSSPATGAHAISGALRGAWWTSGGTAGPLGFPTSELLVVPGGTAQAFSGGSVYSSPATGAHGIAAGFLTPWWATGGATGPLGFPTSDLLTVPGGTAQAFAGGSVYAKNNQPAFAVYGAGRNAWWADGGATGLLGYPTANTTAVGSAGVTRFEGGMLVAGPAGTFRINGVLLTAVDRAGGLGTLGAPISSELLVPGGTAQAFERGSVYWSAASGAHVISGPVRTAWWVAGGVTGVYGFPTGDVAGDATAQSVPVATGTLRWSAANGVWFDAN